jgi:hypothetical protein
MPLLLAIADLRLRHRDEEAERVVHCLSIGESSGNVIVQ